MSASPLHIQYLELVRAAWTELPLLVDSFIERASHELQLPRAELEQAVAELLELPDHAAFITLSRVLGKVYPYVAEGQPEDVPGVVPPESAADDELRGLAMAALMAWQQGGMAAVSQLKPDGVQPRVDFPYELLDRSKEDAPRRSKGLEQLLEFMKDATRLREQVLEGLAVHRCPAPTVDTVEMALDLADILARTVAREVPCLAEGILAARGVEGLTSLMLADIWDDECRLDVDDYALMERADDPRIEGHAERLEGFEGGYPPVWMLKQACIAMSPETLGGAYDDAPRLAGVLAMAPDDARFRVNALEDGPQDYLVPAIHYEGCVRTLDDVARVLRCAPRMPSKLDVLSLEEAQRLGCPAMAGWYRLDWADCL